MSFDFKKINKLYESIKSGNLLVVNKEALQHRKVLELALLWDYSNIRGTYWDTMYSAIVDFLSGKGPSTAYKRRFSNAISQAYYDTAVQAYRDAGADLPLDEDTTMYLNGARDAEIGYLDDLFSKLLMLRKEEKDNARYIAPSTASSRADGYAHTLDAIYANVKLLAKPNVMLTFTGIDGLENCSDCKRYKGKRHRAKWWVANDAVPPSRHFECKGYRCQHHLTDDNGVLYTL